MKRYPFKLIFEALECEEESLNESSGLNNHPASKYSAPGQPFDTRYLTFLRFSVQEYPLDSILALISGV